MKNVVGKLNNVLGWLTAMNFDKPELSNHLEEPLNVLSEAISDVENLAIHDIVIRREQLVEIFEKMNRQHITMLEIGDYNKLAKEMING